MILTTLCYIEKDGKYLMLHRTKKAKDPNEGKWTGIGGRFRDGESPEECVVREVREETGLTLTSFRFRGIVTFVSDTWPAEYMHLFTADGYSGKMTDCDEGDLEWIPKNAIGHLPLWEGDRIFLGLLESDAPFFSLKLEYLGDRLISAKLDGKEITDVSV
jgi:8-oxo-dGTP diphosphatase